MDFPLYSTKDIKIKEKFNLNTPLGRKKYFAAKAGKEVAELKEYLDNNTFIGFMLAKKMAGKGTYSKIFEEIIGTSRVYQFSIGDLIRKVHQTLESDQEEKSKILEYINRKYRGYISDKTAIEALLNRSTEKVSVPTELLLALVKREIESKPRKAVFIDGFPRTLDQVSYSLYFREIMNLRDDPDFFVLIDIPESVIDARLKSRVICPVCNTSRNTRLLPTQFIKYDKAQGDFYLICDNPECNGYGKEKMIPKEGDDLGIKAIKPRLEMDGELMEQAYQLHGIPKVLLRNHVPIEESNKFDSYELTPEYSYEVTKSGKIKINETPWTIIDDDGIESHSLLAAPVVLSMIRQIHKILLG
ncbi:hypothetical protein A2982_00065 [candidate division WWE3 bacterium RIFCSPLOWO2_01_FULL_39_13]|uniref:Adenylate kinase n=1 Tax=candidate division WWE3 bacterium RIFCSPLOWO2_01_FULL_39_13 TaxID=1802624 RepID=A0A1F4V468_UNCKA|nr:MAG: hypothetical protein A2982_00065 [candidate division WWE3 bacterium RIFCSPLOWO2_01_FULL_39_13]